MAEPLLTVEDLSVSFGTGVDETRPVEGVSFRIDPGEIVGVVGESGSGKTMTTLAVSRLLPRGARVQAERIEFAGQDLLHEKDRDLRKLLGTEMAMVFQDPMTSLNPARRIGVQMVEVVREHGGMSRKEARELARQSLADVEIPEPEMRLDQYPYELSGGMRQRVMIAMGLMSRARLVIADEPTTALDVTVQAQVMDLLCEMNRQLGTAVLLVSHNIALLSEVCDRILVMYRGRLVEQLRVDELLSGARHPYTRALVAAVPDLNTDRTIELATVPENGFEIEETSDA